MMRIYVCTGLGDVLEFAAGCLFESPNVRILTDRRLLVQASCRGFDPERASVAKFVDFGASALEEEEAADG